MSYGTVDLQRVDQVAGLAQAAQSGEPGPMRELLTQLRPAIDD